ncbi:MAG TPA: hypothetical protein EYP62_03420, partial [Kiritimatiellae bacterium]|nr:hypothetical protein [Kiritimatiellia bacterium]
MRKLRWVVLAGILLGAAVVYADLLNASFEDAQQGTATNTEYWAWDVPPGWTYGGYWGEVSVEGWRSRSGTNEATIHNWGSAPDGGWWQTATNVVASPGSVWKARAWAVSDAGNWGGGTYTAVGCD